MHKSTILLIPFVLLSTVAAWADSAEYTFTLNTSSIAGTTGSLDFALDPGAGSDQSLTALVSGFLTDGAYGGVQTLTGDATGGPVITGNPLTLNATFADNDDLETFTYGDTLSFKVDLSGPALSAPDGLATSPYEFILSTYSDAAGTIPVLTTDPGGASGSITISPEAVIDAGAISAELSVVATPEPSMLWLLCGALAIFGASRLLDSAKYRKSTGPGLQIIISGGSPNR
jgi:hypothetical protein